MSRSKPAPLSRQRPLPGSPLRQGARQPDGREVERVPLSGARPLRAASCRFRGHERRPRLQRRRRHGVERQAQAGGAAPCQVAAQSTQSMELCEACKAARGVLRGTGGQGTTMGSRFMAAQGSHAGKPSAAVVANRRKPSAGALGTLQQTGRQRAGRHQPRGRRPRRAQQLGPA